MMRRDGRGGGGGRPGVAAPGAGGGGEQPLVVQGRPQEGGGGGPGVVWDFEGAEEGDAVVSPPLGPTVGEPNLENITGILKERVQEIKFTEFVVVKWSGFLGRGF